MDETQMDSLSQDANNVMESVGVEPLNAESADDSDAGSNLAKEADPHAVKKRLGMQAKKHQREMRAMQEQLMQMQAHIGQQQTPSQNAELSYGQPNNQGMSIEEQIQRGVRFALQAKEDQERKAKEAEHMAHIHKQYQRLNSEFDKASEKYEDFDDVVRGEEAPFTHAVRDALLLVDNPSEVAYKLGKNPDELRRISKLHPLDQAREVNKLSIALMGGSGNASSAPSGNGVKLMSPIKANPVTSSANNSPASIRARMKAGTWK